MYQYGTRQRFVKFSMGYSGTYRSQRGSSRWENSAPTIITLLTAFKFKAVDKCAHFRHNNKHKDWTRQWHKYPPRSRSDDGAIKWAPIITKHAAAGSVTIAGSRSIWRAAIT